jgi:uncharacterized protein YjcR
MNISTPVPTVTPKPDAGPATRDAKRGRGAPAGNKNAKRQGFYSRQNLEANLAFLKENTDLSRADREIFLAARKATEVGLRDPSNEPLQAKAMNQFFKLVMRKYGITDKHDEEALSNALEQVERDICLPPEQMVALMKQLV